MLSYSDSVCIILYEKIRIYTFVILFLFVKYFVWLSFFTRFFTNFFFFFKYCFFRKQFVFFRTNFFFIEIFVFQMFCIVVKQFHDYHICGNHRIWCITIFKLQINKEKYFIFIQVKKIKIWRAVELKKKIK